MKELLKHNFFYKVKNKLYVELGLFSLDKVLNKYNDKLLPKNYKIFEAENVDEELLRQYSKKYRSKNHFEKNILPRLKNSNRFKGFVVIDLYTNELAYLSWIDLKKIEIKEVSLHKNLTQKEVYFFDDDCVIHHRRKGLHNAVFIKRLNFCLENNINQIYISIYLNNFRAIGNISKFNFKLSKKYYFSPLINRLIKSVK